MLLSATWGLGSSIAQGEVTPDRYELDARRRARRTWPPAARTTASAARTTPEPDDRSRPAALVAEPCLDRRAGRRARRGCCAEPRTSMGMPVEIEWALDDDGVQAAAGAPAAHASRRTCRTRSGCSTRGSTAIRPASAGATGRAVVINCECELGARRAGRCARHARRRARRSATSCRAWPASSPSAAAARRTSRRSRASAASRWCSAWATPPADPRRRAGGGRRRRRHRALDEGGLTLVPQGSRA